MGKKGLVHCVVATSSIDVMKSEQRACCDEINEIAGYWQRAFPPSHAVSPGHTYPNGSHGTHTSSCKFVSRLQHVSSIAAKF